MGESYSKQNRGKSPPQQDATGKVPANLSQKNSSLSQNDSLLHIIEIDYGLLDELRSSRLLTQEQSELIESKPTHADKVRQLLHTVDPTSQEQYERFLTALDSTQQSHISNVIRHNGQRPFRETEDWPMYGSRPWYQIERNLRQLKALLDTRNGLLDDLLSSQCINSQQRAVLSKEPIDAVRNEALLAIIQRRRLQDYRKFLVCLTTTNQHLVLTELEQNINPIEVQPDDVSIRHGITVEANYPVLVQCIDVKESGLLAKLYDVGCITNAVKCDIELKTSQMESIKCLMDAVKRGSQHDFNKFIKCLDDTGQTRVSGILLGDGAATAIVAKISKRGCIQVNDDDEAGLVDRFRSFRARIAAADHNISRADIEQMSAQVNEIDKQLKQKDIQLSAMQSEHGIKMFFVCGSLPGLLHLNELYATGELKMIIESFFDMLLLEDTALPTRSVIVDLLRWDMSEYSKCAQYLFLRYGLPYHSLIYELTQSSPDNAGMLRSCLLSSVMLLRFDKLPIELIELLLLKAAGQMFTVMKKTWPTNAHKLTVTALCGVCKYWRETLCYEQRNRRLIKQYVQHVCAPYRFNPRRIASQRVPGSNGTMGVALLNYKLYVVSERSSSVHVLPVDSRRTGEVTYELTVPEMRSPQDIVACPETNCLYISDYGPRCIWRLSLTKSSSPKETAKKFITTEYNPWTLSVQSDRLVVTALGGLTVYEYKAVDGKLLRTIKLTPPYVKTAALYNIAACHAVATTEETIIVCHAKSWINRTKREHRAGVSEMSRHGIVSQVYDGKVGFSEPNYLIMDSKKKGILVSEGYHREIIYVNRQLTQSKYVLGRRDLSGQPSRMCYSQEKGLLYVCYNDLPLIDVYEI